MQGYFEYLRDIGDDSHSFIEKISVSLAIFLVIYILRLIVSKILDHAMEDDKKKHKIMAVSRFITVIICAYLILYVWFSRAKSVGLIIGIALSLLFLALKDLIIDIFAFIYISVRKPFTVGDLIEVDGVRGEVIDMDFIQFNMAEMGELIDCVSPTGRYVSIPNRSIFNKPVYNYNRKDPFVVQDIYILIDADSDREKALEIAGKIAYERYTKMIENYDEEAMDHFKKAVKSMGGDYKPKIRALSLIHI